MIQAHFTQQLQLVILILACLLEFFFHKINVTPRLFGTLEYYVIDKTWFVTIPACLVVLLLCKQSSCRKQNWWVTKDKFLWQKSCAVSVRSRSLCALTGFTSGNYCTFFQLAHLWIAVVVSLGRLKSYRQAIVRLYD